MAPSAITPPIEDYHLSSTLSRDDSLTDIHEYGATLGKKLVGEAFKRRVEIVDSDTCEVGDEDAFFVADLGEVYRQHMRWKRNLPRVKPHYAVKCNPDPQVLRILAAMGTGFDCASKAELEQVLKMGIDPSRIIFAQPCKIKSHVRYANSQGVRQMTFDNAEELYKVKQLYPTAELYLRILTDDSESLCRLSMKFGASLSDADDLLRLARDLDLNVAGVAFHVGSGASDPKAFLRAIRDARYVFDRAALLGLAPHTLDIGGGFVPESFDRMAGVVSAALDEYFPPSVRVIAEPGRYYVSNAFNIACHVIARRTVLDDDDTHAGISAGGVKAGRYMLYLNDGVYGNFSSIIFDHQHPIPRVLKRGSDIFYGSALDDDKYDGQQGFTEYSIWGPTCDGIDCISEKWAAPLVLDVGDWLYFEDMGAYTKCSATRFNGFTDQHHVEYVCSEAGAQALLREV